MKWFLFFILLICVLSCKDNKQKEKYPEYDSSLMADSKNNSLKIHTKQRADSVENQRLRDSIEKYELPLYTVDDRGYFRDSGYFRGPLLVPVDYEEKGNSGMLTDFLSRNLSKKDIVLLNDSSLSHSAFIDKKQKLRLDTLRNKNVTIISRYMFGDKESQTITINGTVVRKYNDVGIDSLRQDILTLYQSSFLDFRFKGKEFYFISAGIMDCGGGSACLTDIQLLYDVANKSLNEFRNFRIGASSYLFGDIDGDDKLDFLEIDNDGGYGSISDSVNKYRIIISSCNKSGMFEQVKDSGKKEYYIEGNSGTDYYVGEQMYIDKFYWPVKLK